MSRSRKPRERLCADCGSFFTGSTQEHPECQKTLKHHNESCACVPCARVRQAWAGKLTLLWKKTVRRLPYPPEPRSAPSPSPSLSEPASGCPPVIGQAELTVQAARIVGVKPPGNRRREFVPAQEALYGPPDGQEAIGPLAPSDR